MHAFWMLTNESQAIKLHSDSLDGSFEHEKCSKRCKVGFVPFVGIGPRRYLDIFSTKLSSGPSIKKKKDGILIGWDKATAVPRIPSSQSSEELREKFLEMARKFLKEGGEDEPNQNENG